jgi:predicted SprT family Zn-dependent metalloprotease
MIAKCKCRNSYQDKRYGQSKRVHNPTKDGNNMACVVCGDKKVTSRGMREAALKKGKKKK